MTSFSTPPTSQNYSVAVGTSSNDLSVPIYLDSAPTSSLVNYPVGKRAIVQSANSTYTLTSKSSANGIVTANWQADSGSSLVDSVLGTTNQITVTTVGSTATASLPAAITAPGSLTTTTTLASGTTVTAGTGFVATLGNVLIQGAANGINISNMATASGVASGPVALNGRAGSITFTSVSIAAGATLTLTMTNSSIVGGSQRVLYSMSGATAGAALSVVSVTPSASTYAWVVTNGTGATTSTANITFDFMVIN